MVEIKNIYFEYGSLRAVDDVSVRWERGDFVALIGRNGGGKTTLARCMAGFLRPRSGLVRIAGKDVHRLRPRERVQVIGYVFQNPDHQLFKESVEEEVRFGLENIGVSANEADRRCVEILERLELAGKRELHPFRLARGDRQRLAIASVAVLEPKVLVVDEPTTGQDPVKAREIMSLLLDLNTTKGTTIIIITHAMDLVAEYAKTVAVMATGKLLLGGSPREVFRRGDVLEMAGVAAPPVVRLGLKLGLEPVPLSVNEFTETFRNSV